MVKTFNPMRKRVNKVRVQKQKNYDNNWRKFSKAYRKKHPFCKECLQKGVYNSDNLEVDHIIPITQRPDLKYSETNLQTLCKSHHAQKTYTETLGG